MTTRHRCTSLTRRVVLAGLPGLLTAATPGAAADRLAALERLNGGRLGVFALETGSGRILAHRADERFLMCSTFKLLLAATMLARVEAGHEQLHRLVRYAAPAPSSASSARIISITHSSSAANRIFRCG